MATQNARRSTEVEDKAQIDMVETAYDPEAASINEKELATDKKVDYSGFSQKTDPREIKLVRKLDMYIMVSQRDVARDP